MSPLNDTCRGDGWALRKANYSCLKTDSDSTSPHLRLEWAKGHPSHHAAAFADHESRTPPLSPALVRTKVGGPAKGRSCPRSSGRGSGRIHTPRAAAPLLPAVDRSPLPLSFLLLPPLPYPALRLRLPVLKMEATPTLFYQNGARR